MPRNDSTEFGKYLLSRGISDNAAAEVLGRTAAYVGMLRRGKATPQLHLAVFIEGWSGGSVRCTGWFPDYLTLGTNALLRVTP